MNPSEGVFQHLSSQNRSIRFLAPMSHKWINVGYKLGVPTPLLPSTYLSLLLPAALSHYSALIPTPVTFPPIALIMPVSWPSVWCLHVRQNDLSLKKCLSLYKRLISLVQTPACKHSNSWERDLQHFNQKNRCQWRIETDDWSADMTDDWSADMILGIRVLKV